MERSSLEVVTFVVRTMTQTAVDNEKYFGDLDAVVGDGDYGYSLARGFEKVLLDWNTIESTTIGTFLKKVSIIITSRIGGTSGPIWGTAFLRAAIAVGDKQEIGAADVTGMLRAAIEGIKKRGQSDLGDKTLLDALVPAVDQLEQSLNASTSPPVRHPPRVRLCSRWGKTKWRWAWASMESRAASAKNRQLLHLS